MTKLYDFDPRLQHPFTCMVVGPTQSGKTQFVLRMIKHCVNFVTPPPERIVWCFGCYQNDFGKLSENVEFVEGIPNADLLDGVKRTLIIIDDLMSETNDRVTHLFTKGSHHKNASVVYISQNLFHKGKENRDISLNTHYLVLFKNPRDSAQISHLGRQIFPERVKYFRESFADATSKSYGYLLVDLKPTTPDELRLRTDIFPNENAYVYIYK
jgi:hypothetical protein